MRCRRCGYNRLIKLGKRHVEDNDVLRCGECGFIFSPAYHLTRRSEETNPEGAPADQDSLTRRNA